VSHPIVALQAALVGAWAAAGLAVSDMPPRAQAPPYGAIARHDLLARDGDGAPGWEHRVVLHVWAKEARRAEALALAQGLMAVALDAELSPEGLMVTHRRHERTDTLVDTDIGQARAAVALRFFTEPA